MKPDCRTFRARLADALRGPLAAAHEPALGGLGWHRHVIDCGACRELLSEEEALDELLRSLPQPHLPRALAERVLSRLESARRGGDLDRLLDLPLADPAPADLAQHVLARVHAERRLDRLLERVLPERVPVGLERRILARLEPVRRGKTAPQPAKSARKTQPAQPVLPARRASAARSTTGARPAPIRLPLRIAAGVAIASFAGWGAWNLRRVWLEPGAQPPPEIATIEPSVETIPQPLPIPVTPIPAAPDTDGVAIAAPDEQLLASLEMFEAWDLLASADGVDASLATLDSLDEYLLEFETEAPTTENDPQPPAPAGTPDTEPKGAKENG